VTELVLRDYLDSLAWYLERMAIEGWLSGKQTLAAEGELRGRLIQCALLQHLRLDDVQAHFTHMEQLRAA
jgi:hypothetical protein